MLNRWNSLPLTIKRRFIFPTSSLIFSKPTVSAAKLDGPEPTTSISSIDPNPSDPVHEIVTNLKTLGFHRFVGENYLRNLEVSRLSESQIDRIIDSLQTESPDTAVQFFHWLRSEYGFKHSKYSSVVVSHVLAAKKRFKELRFVLEQLLREEDGYRPDQELCEVICNAFHQGGDISSIFELAAGMIKSGLVPDQFMRK